MASSPRSLGGGTGNEPLSLEVMVELVAGVHCNLCAMHLQVTLRLQCTKRAHSAMQTAHTACNIISATGV